MSVPDPNRHIDAAFIDVEEGMETKITEIADGIYRLSTYVPHIAPPAGFTYNQFLVLGDEPLMFHTGLRKTFPVNRDALSRIMPADRLRWIAFGHFEADECGAMNEWLAVAPQASLLTVKSAAWYHSTILRIVPRAYCRTAKSSTSAAASASVSSTNRTPHMVGT